MKIRDELLYRVNLATFYGSAGLLVVAAVVDVESALTFAGLSVAMLSSALALHWLTPRVFAARRRRGTGRR